MASNRMYGECLRNHAVKLGLYANDGCGEFMLDTVNPSSLMCDACKCHRSFHRRLFTSPPLPPPHPPPPLPPLPPTPPPARPLRIAEPKPEEKPMKFTAKQEGKMKKFAKKLGWRIISDETDPEVDKFCAEIGVSKENLITWLLDNDVENFLPRIACSSSESASVNKI